MSQLEQADIFYDELNGSDWFLWTMAIFIFDGYFWDWVDAWFV